VGEGWLLAWLFSVPKGKAVWVMVVANYASAWLGGLFARGAIIEALPMDLNNGWRWFWCMVVVTYIMTLIIEWPFVAWTLRGTRDWFKLSLRSSLLVQSASYAVIFGWYWMFSGTSLYTQMNIVSPSDLSLPDSVLVYYIDPLHGDVYKRWLTGSESEKVYVLDSKHENDRLYVLANESNTNRWDIGARLETGDRQNPRFIDLVTNLMVEAAPDRLSTFIDPPGTWDNFGRVPSIGSATNSHWEFWSGYWSMEGLEASDTTTAKLTRFAYETPFGAWRVRNAVHLPSDKVLFQLGDDQICAFDPTTRKVALLWHGRGPLAMIEKIRPEKRDEATTITSDTGN
jgi:hypothetical protein